MLNFLNLSLQERKTQKWLFKHLRDVKLKLSLNLGHKFIQYLSRHSHCSNVDYESQDVS
jgi:hypothetical protein